MVGMVRVRVRRTQKYALRWMMGHGGKMGGRNGRRWQREGREGKGRKGKEGVEKGKETERSVKRPA